jgi:hypothetical protein
MTPFHTYVNPEGSDGILHRLEAVLTHQHAQVLLRAAKDEYVRLHAPVNSVNGTTTAMPGNGTTSDGVAGRGRGGGDHDWLHSVKLPFRVMFLPPDDPVPWPWWVKFLCAFIYALMYF